MEGTRTALSPTIRRVGRQDSASIRKRRERHSRGTRTAQAPPPLNIHPPVPTGHGWRKRQFPTFSSHLELQM
ncbi:MAG TPA: hypothetical protein VIX20_09210 [Ktedonobacteraceae bacterium]